MVAKRTPEKVSPDKVDPDARVNPSTRLIARNPTRMEISDADNQREIVQQIKDMRAKRKKILYQYEQDENGNWEYSGLPGTIAIRKLEEEELAEYFRTLMRSRPNIIGIELSFGEYEDARQYTGKLIDKLRFSKPRNPTELAEDMAALFSTKTPEVNVVKLNWKINSANAGNFYTEATAYYTSKENYEDDKKFSPSIMIEHVQM